MTFRGAIYDVDGVIVDTVPLHFRAWKKMFNSFGYQFTEMDYKEKVDGKPRSDGAKSIMINHSQAEIEKGCGMKQEFFLEFIAQGQLKPFSSTLALLDELLAKNILLASASSSKNSPLILEKVGIIKQFKAVVSGHDFSRGKPDPEIFLTAAQEIGVNVAQCIVFEDAKSGVAAAKNGGFLCVGIDRHNHPDYLEGADFIVKDLSELSFEKLKKMLPNR